MLNAQEVNHHNRLNRVVGDAQQKNTPKALPGTRTASQPNYDYLRSYSGVSHYFQ